MLVTSKDGPFAHLTDEQIKKIKQIHPEAELSEGNESSEDIKNADILITQFSANIDFEKLPNLKWIQSTFAGVNNMPASVKNSAVLVTSASGVHPIPISEHVLAFILMFVRNIHISFRNQIIEKKWIRSDEMRQTAELEDSTMGIIGLGRIGREIAKKAKAFNMKVLAVVRNPDRTEQNVDELVGMDKLEHVLKNSDFIVNCLPSTDQTRSLFDLSKFKLMKPNSYFINIGRGDAVVENDLIECLKNGTIRGAGLDVFEEEPLPDSSPLWNLENVILTPHNSSWTPHYADRVIDIFCENLKAYLKNEPLPTLVDKKLGY